MSRRVAVYAGEALAAYGFGDGHPFGPDREAVFRRGMTAAGLDHAVDWREPVDGTREQVELFHTREYVDLVVERCAAGTGYLDAGDTPAIPGLYEAGLTVVGTAVAAADALMAGEADRAFQAIGGLHHAQRGHAAGFCVFDDCGVVIEHLRMKHGLKRVAYVDIDAHHGDGVYYGFEDDPDLLFADLHEDGRFLYPGSGARTETGIGAAVGTKLNLPMPPGADDEAFRAVWPQVEAYLEAGEPEFIVLQCGADALAGDPITHLRYSEAAHAEAAASLCRIADRFCPGRILGLGGGGYNRDNIARAWPAVVAAFLA